MQCFILGTGGMMPMPQRPLTSVVVRPSSTMVQLDCGEGVQVGLKELRLGIKQLRVVAITHLHADHCLGLPGVLMFRAQCDEPGPLTITGPAGIAQFVRHVVSDLSCYLGYPLDFREWSPGSDLVAYEDDEIALRWEPLTHGVTCLGYRLDEHQRPGKFDPDRAVAAGVPVGPLWGRLQGGEDVTLDGGRVIRPDQVLGPPRRGRSVAFCTDTAPCAAIGELCRGVDVAFVESMFLPEHEDEGRRKLHLTVTQAAHATREAGALRTELVHISPRYGPADIKQMNALACSINPSARIARPLSVIDVPLPD
jgi:ribonuclease Z